MRKDFLILYLKQQFWGNCLTFTADYIMKYRTSIASTQGQFQISDFWDSTLRANVLKALHDDK